MLRGWRRVCRVAGSSAEARRADFSARSVAFRSAKDRSFAERKATLRAEKSALLASALDPATRHTRLQPLNTALRATLVEYEQQVRHDLQQYLITLPHQQFLRSREFSANLFPKEAMQALIRRAWDGCRSSQRD